MRGFWKELTLPESLISVRRLVFFVATSHLCFGVVLPLLSWLLLNGQFENIGVPNILITYAFDNFYSTLATSVVLMELAYQSRRRPSLFGIAMAGYFMFKLPLVAMMFGPLKMGIMTSDQFVFYAKQFFPLTLASFFFTAIGLTVPIVSGVIAKKWFSKIDGQVLQKLMVSQFIKLAVLFVSPFLIVAGIVFVTAYFTPVGAMLPYFFLVPWIYLLTSFTIVCFSCLCALRIKSDNGFSAWFVVMAVLVPFFHYCLTIQFPEQKSSAVSLLVFGLVVFLWRKWINSILKYKVSAT